MFHDDGFMIGEEARHVFCVEIFGGDIVETAVFPNDSKDIKEVGGAVGWWGGLRSVRWVVNILMEKVVAGCCHAECFRCHGWRVKLIGISKMDEGVAHCLMEEKHRLASLLPLARKMKVGLRPDTRLWNKGSFPSKRYFVTSFFQS